MLAFRLQMSDKEVQELAEGNFLGTAGARQYRGLRMAVVAGHGGGSRVGMQEAAMLGADAERNAARG
jgi:hypothetical protein